MVLRPINGVFLLLFVKYIFLPFNCNPTNVISKQEKPWLRQCDCDPMRDVPGLDNRIVEGFAHCVSFLLTPLV